VTSRASDPKASAESAVGALGHPRVHLRRTDSTNDRARGLALVGAPHGTLVTASEQSAGRGRQGRRWSAPAGSSLLMSLLLRSPPRLLPLMAAIAVAEVAGESALIKWPNDVVVPLDGGAGAGLAKLAGILMEGRPQEGWAVLGIGINVAVRLQDLPPELRPGADVATPSRLPAATLGRGPEDVEPTLARLLDALQRSLALSPEETLKSWRRRDALRGREVSWSSGSGRAQGIDGDGRLVVALDGGGQTTIGSGEVHLERIGW
jgi:BirA family biotin operon repressor/biotin-[acetyl-CoA-carboxylase] ligase